VKRILLLAWVAIAASCVAQQTGDALTHVTVLTSSDAGMHPDRTRVASALNQIVSFLHVEPMQLPDLVVIYAPRRSTHVDALSEDAKVTVAKINFEATSLYQVWITGVASDDNTIQGLIWALNRHYALHLTDERISEVRQRVSRQMTDIVSATALQRGR
jgi:hypothetical protein